MGRTVPFSSEQLDLLSRFDERCSAGSFFVTENWTGFFSASYLAKKGGCRGKGDLGLQLVESQW